MKIFCSLLFFIYTASYAQDSLYKLGSNSFRKAGVPVGVVTKYDWYSTLYNNYREYYVYVPAQYDSSKPAALMVFLDGASYANEKGDWRVPIVYDNLIEQKRLPVTICLFVNPGHATKDYPESRYKSSNRSVEYDDLSEKYSSMLLTELIPQLTKQYNISDSSSMHGIAGLSSGAIGAFTAAWHHPEYFSKVLSHYGSFTDIRGGHNYPSLIRKNKKKDIKIFMQDGINDLDNEFGNWWLANLQMEAAFKYKGYDFRFEKGLGTHNSKHGSSILSESLEWLWDTLENK
jgi:enterochelin esterase-like enzyme